LTSAASHRLIAASPETCVNLNKLYIVGTLKTDPETRETHSGSSVTRIVLTVHRDYFSKERNQRVRESDSFEVQAWGGLGQQIAQQFKKGAQILIEGRLKQDTWETPTGERRQRTVVHAENYAPVGVGMPAGAPAEGAEAPSGAEEGPTPTAGPPGAPGTSGKRKRRRRRGPRRDGLPPGPITPQTPEERAAFAAGLVDASAGNPQPSSSDAPAPPKAESAPPTPPTPSAPPPPPAPAPPAEKPKPATSLKEDMPF
jgi:single-strand DNA-binding protein